MGTSPHTDILPQKYEVISHFIAIQHGRLLVTLKALEKTVM